MAKPGSGEKVGTETLYQRFQRCSGFDLTGKESDATFIEQANEIYVAGFEAAHQLRDCGHSRGDFRAPNYPHDEENYSCVGCDSVREALEVRMAGAVQKGEKVGTPLESVAVALARFEEAQWWADECPGVGEQQDRIKQCYDAWQAALAGAVQQKGGEPDYSKLLNDLPDKWESEDPNGHTWGCKRQAAAELRAVLRLVTGAALREAAPQEGK